MEPRGCNQWQPRGKSTQRRSGENKPKPLPSVATACVRRSMVRRGSTVRVRQRACTKALQIGIWRCLPWRDFDAAWVRDGYILRLADTRGHARPSRDAARDVLETGDRDHRLGKFLQTQCWCCPVARAGATLPTSFASPEVNRGEGWGSTLARSVRRRSPAASRRTRWLWRRSFIAEQRVVEEGKVPKPADPLATPGEKVVG